jgi:hypothetical protein
MLLTSPSFLFTADYVGGGCGSNGSAGKCRRMISRHITADMSFQQCPTQRTKSGMESVGSMIVLSPKSNP